MHKKSKPLRDVELQAKINHWNARNMLMLEAVIAAMLDCDNHKGVADKLRLAADQLEEYY